MNVKFKKNLTGKAPGKDLGAPVTDLVDCAWCHHIKNSDVLTLIHYLFCFRCVIF